MTARLLALLLTLAATASAASRSPAVAGAFYPAEPERLRADVDRLLERAAGRGSALAVVAPHAGYDYSGAVAAEAFAALAADRVSTIILLGPSHHVGFAGGALPAVGVTAFSTPLGDVELERRAVEKLRSRSGFGGPAEAHRPEHCLEVELPFLQAVAPRARIVPILVGVDTDRELARTMAGAISELLDEHTALVVSTDFTHHGARYRYEPFAGARDLGGALLDVGRTTAELVAASDSDGLWYQLEVSGDTVCGRRPLQVLAELTAHAFDGSGRVLDVTTSGHVTGSFDLSVTYAAVAFDGVWRRWGEVAGGAAVGRLSGPDGRDLLRLARATLRSHLAHDAALAHWFAGRRQRAAFAGPAGAFVTLNNTGERVASDGRLRACMGVIEARQPLLDAVIQAAVSAAHDPRFPRLELAELDRLELEVSVLSPPWNVAGPDAITVGEHGVVLSKGGRRAVFLPQVAVEQGWSRDEMLDQLARKAGLPADAWRRGASFEVFTAQVVSEEQ